MIYIPSGNHCWSNPSFLTFFFKATFTSAFHTLCTSITFYVLYRIIYFCSFSCLALCTSLTLRLPLLAPAYSVPRTETVIPVTFTRAVLALYLVQNHYILYLHLAPLCTYSPSLYSVTLCVLYRISFTPTYSQTLLRSFPVFK